jgi:hypothetical protein
MAARQASRLTGCAGGRFLVAREEEGLCVAGAGPVCLEVCATSGESRLATTIIPGIVTRPRDAPEDLMGCPL